MRIGERVEPTGVAWVLEGEGVTVASLADALAILADELLATGRKRDRRIAGAIAAWIDSARSGEWWLWRSPLMMGHRLHVGDFARVVEATQGRVPFGLLDTLRVIGGRRYANR